jgi:hypothetical protein
MWFAGLAAEAGGKQTGRPISARHDVGIVTVYTHMHQAHLLRDATAARCHYNLKICATCLDTSVNC